MTKNKPQSITWQANGAECLTKPEKRTTINGALRLAESINLTWTVY